MSKRTKLSEILSRHFVAPPHTPTPPYLVPNAHRVYVCIYLYERAEL